MHQSDRQKLKEKLIEIAMQAFFTNESPPQGEWGKKFASGSTLKQTILNRIEALNDADNPNKAALKILADQLEIMPDEERYGTVKFSLPPDPEADPKTAPNDTIASMIRFKRTDAKDVPHTEDLIARLQGQTTAAQRLIAESSLSEPEKIGLYQQLNKALEMAEQDMTEYCDLDPDQIPTHRKITDNDKRRIIHTYITAEQDKNTDLMEKLRTKWTEILSDEIISNEKKHHYINEKQDKSAFIMQKLSDKLADVLLDANIVEVTPKQTLKQRISQAVGFEADSKKDLASKKQIIKDQIYLKETEIMSKKRPELVVVRPIQVDGKEPHIAVNIVPPVNPKRTISSAKKDEQGMANFVYSENWVADETGSIKDKRPISLRSGSPVPQDIFFDGKNEDLIREVTRMNVRHHLMPALADMADPKSGKGTQTDPIIIDYTLQTLLSPTLESIDRQLNQANPDAIQVSAIRDTLNGITNRPIQLDDGRYVQINVNYLNTGCNFMRGESSMEDALNAKGFNQLIGRNSDLIQKASQDLSENVNAKEISDILKSTPQFSTEENKKLKQYDEALQKKYEKLDKQDLSKEKHARLTELIVKEKRSKSKKYQIIPLSPTEKRELKALKKERHEINEIRGPIEKAARQLESQKESMHRKLQKDVLQYFNKNHDKFSSAIAALESSETESEKSLGAHCRALEQYIQLTAIGYDPRLNKLAEKRGEHSNDNNKRNYQPQAYVRLLCDKAGMIYHKTCKSGKDRTNSSEEMENALHQATVMTGTVLQLSQDKKWEDDLNRQFLIALYDDGYMHGNGNYICGQNMNPGAQQVSSADIPSDLDVDVWKNTLAKFQKGAYKSGELKSTPEALENSRLVSNRYSEQSVLLQSCRQLNILSAEVTQSIHNQKEPYLRNLSLIHKKNSGLDYEKQHSIHLEINKLMSEDPSVLALEKYQEHIALMIDLSRKIILIEYQLEKKEFTAKEREQLTQVQTQLKGALEKGYQELREIKQDTNLPDDFKKNKMVNAQLQIFESVNSALFAPPQTGALMTLIKLGSNQLEQILSNEKETPKITTKRSLNPKTEQHYVVQYTDLPPLDVTERLNRDKSHELIVTAKTDNKSKTLDPAILDQIVKIAQNTVMGPGTTIEVIAPNAEQALQVAIALKTAGIQPNVDSFDNGSQQIAFSAEAKAKLNTIETKPKNESANEFDKPVPHVGALSALHIASKKTDSPTKPEPDSAKPDPTRTRARGKTL